MASQVGSLHAIELFKDLPSRDLEALAKRCQWRRYAANNQIVGHLDETRDVFFIVEARVRPVLYSLSGKEVTFRDIEAGEMFGEFAAIDGEPRSASVIALVDSLVAVMTAENFWHALRHHPDVAAITLRRLTTQLRVLSERVFEFSTLAVRNRIHAELLRLARDHMKDARSAVISPAPSHAAIASRISTHREAVTREMGALHRAGLIDRRGGDLIIRDTRRLEQMVSDVLGY